MKKIIFILLLPINSFAAFIGNIAEPNLYNQGLISSSNSIGIRSSYVYDNIYKGRYKDRFQTLNSTPTDTKLITQGGLIALSFFKWIDIYGMAGESKFQLDQLIFTNNCFSWAIGSKCLLFK